MDAGAATQLIVLVILLMLSSFFSSAETALTTVNKHKIRAKVDEGNKSAARVLQLIDNPSKMLSTILIGNNIVNITASSIATILATKLWSSAGAGIATGVLTLLILVFGEITPKNIAAIYSEPISLAYARVIYCLTCLLTPIIFILNKICYFIYWILRINPQHNQTMTESELRTIVNVSHEDGVIEGEEKKMITNVVDFGDSVAKDIMIPRVDMTSASIDAEFDEIFALFQEDQYSRIPIYEEHSDNIVGILNMKDLFFYREKQEEFNIKDLLREPLYTYEYQKTTDVMTEMRKHSVSITIVLNEYGAAAGMITLEDLLEEIVGEIRDEYDQNEAHAILKVSDREYEVDGSTKLDDLNDVLDTELESEDYDSVGGHLIELLDRLPEEGDVALDGDLRFTVLKADKTRVERVRVDLIPEKVEMEAI